jgi:hypothetical protein
MVIPHIPFQYLTAKRSLANVRLSRLVAKGEKVYLCRLPSFASPIEKLTLMT